MYTHEVASLKIASLRCAEKSLGNKISSSGEELMVARMFAGWLASLQICLISKSSKYDNDMAIFLDKHKVLHGGKDYDISKK